MNIIQFNSPERSSNLNEKNWLVRTNQTITFLPMVIVLFIGLIGYEWLRTELVGSWILGGVSKSMLFILTALYKTMINVKETQIKSFYMIQNFLRKTAGSSYCSLYSMS